MHESSVLLRSLKIAFLALVVASAAMASALAGEITVELDLAGNHIEGAPKVFNDSVVLLLGRDGRLFQFAPSAAKNFRKVANGFRPYAGSDLRAILSQEFGGSFDVSGTGHYLVVHPSGQRDLWADRFEELYRSFIHYFSARGLNPKAPLFPLVAVVLPTQHDFIAQAKREGVQLNAGVLGYYSPSTNRVLMYDETGPRVPAAQWHRNAETIIHEATHQTAFNTGLHNRMAMPPRWVGEGLATMFEARGVWDARSGGERPQRVNHNQLAQYREFASKRRAKGALFEMIASDNLFRADVSGAYAQAWALTFFLAEMEPRKYGQYLSVLNARAPIANLSAQERLREFTTVFSDSPAMLDARFTRFIADLE